MGKTLRYSSPFPLTETQSSQRTQREDSVIVDLKLKKIYNKKILNEYKELAMNKKIILYFFVILSFFIFSGCKDAFSPETIYLVRAGGQLAGSGHYETGVFVSPNGSLVPYLIEDGRNTGTLSEVESILSQLGFNQNWIQSVKNNLNRNKSAFVFYTNTSSYYRWFWITEN